MAPSPVGLMASQKRSVLLRLPLSSSPTAQTKLFYLLSASDNILSRALGLDHGQFFYGDRRHLEQQSTF